MHLFNTSDIDYNLLCQNTIKDKISFSGVGIHNGKAVIMNLLPADVNTGIIFKRLDLNENNIVKVEAKNIVRSKFCSKITNDYGYSITTLEHLMAALKALYIDNVIIEINSSELPALDGSSDEYVSKILQIGRKRQTAPRKFLKIKKELKVNQASRWIKISPSEQLSIDLEINYPNTYIGKDRYCYVHKESNFVNEVCYARTFAFAKDIEKLRASGFGIGGNLNNAIVVEKNKLLNKNGLKCKNEFIKHKVLDCIGDLYLSGYQIIGDVKSYAPGHELNFEIINKIFSSTTNFELIELERFNFREIQQEIPTAKYSVA